MNNEKSVKLREGLDILTEYVKNEIEVLETETITWRCELEKALDGDPLVALDIEGVMYVGDYVEKGLKQLEKEFDPGYGYAEGASFCAWSPHLVIFTEEHDGHQWLRTINRNPSRVKKEGT